MNYKEILDSTRQQATASRPQHAFSTQRERALELDLCLRTGDRWSFPYAYKTAMKFDLSGTIILYFTTHEVTIQGRNLISLFDGLITHSVSQIREQSHDFDEVAEGSTVINALRVEEK